MTQNSKKEKILNAALDIISDEGLRGLTFRAIAKKADVTLGITTYYYKSIEELYIDAYEFFDSKVNDVLDGLYLKASQLLFSEGELSQLKLSQQQKIINDLSILLTSYVKSQVSTEAKYRKIAAAFMHAAIVNSVIKNHEIKRQQSFVEMGERWFSQLNVSQPKVIANLFVALLAFFERQFILLPENDFDSDGVTDSLKHFFTMVFNSVEKCE
ncbi:TetR family transcriptional regulator [Aliikangiella sp. G2MR2-5]|uniref:TetR family transcriptional regulator n=1 Tax=Aliikangiella sp. G2MR2-5 TaxID=2788943 RepID=UPI0018ABAEBA|nr:TetR family transcriptional regulator [Aliikangiella sp. G2MR2-5]